MKQRTVTACIGLALFFIILFFFNSIVYDIAICIVSLIAVHELLLATKVTKSIPLAAICMIGSLMPFLYPVNDTSPHLIAQCLFLNVYYPALYILIAILGTIIVLTSRKKVGFKQLLFGMLSTIVAPALFYILIIIRNEYGVYYGVYYTLLIFACSWGADSGAYFAGRFFGKRKLAPKISPNKTIEGVYGGVASSVLFVSLVTVAFYFAMKYQGEVIAINYWGLLIVGLIGSIVSVFGDLSASLIKRKCEIKDFGSIMPGHGGILDRFDSVLLVAPFMFILLKFISL